MRVLAVGNLYPPAAAGGYERIWVDAMRALQAAGHDVRVLTTAPVAGRPVDGPDPEGPPVHRDLAWWWRDFGFPRRTLRERVAIERRNAAVIRPHLAWADVVSWWGMGGMSMSLIEHARRAGVPGAGVVGDLWMGYGFAVDGWMATRVRRVLGPLVGVPGWVDIRDVRWLFISRWVAERAREAVGELPRTGLAHPGAEPSAFPARDPGPWRGRLAYVGRVEERKGVAVAVRALADLPDAALTVDGEAEPAYRAELDALATELGVAERVRFTRTPSDRVADAYAGADAVLFPVTWEEPWGLVPLEAMSVGRPVVATGTGGSGEYLRDGDNALLAAPGDPAALAAAVRRLAADPDLRARLVAAGRRTAARYSAPAFEQAVIAALEAAAARR